MSDDNSDNGNNSGNGGGDSGGASSGDTRPVERFLSLIGFIALVGCVAMFANFIGLASPPTNSAQGADSSPHRAGRIALVSGHAGHDSGAVCINPAGHVTLTEAEVVSAISELTAHRLRQAGYDTMVLQEYDPRLDGLQADVLLSLHADSCVPMSGYKAAYYVHSATPMSGDRLLECIDIHYAGVTGLAKHPDTVTVDMTEYHAFRKIDPSTPAAILELGFLGGDRVLLTDGREIVAEGVAKSLFCFLEH